MTGSRRLSQAISEGDGISLLVPVRDGEQAGVAETDGADAVVLESTVAAIREATTLPVVYRAWAAHPDPREAIAAGADGYIVSVAAVGEERLRNLYVEALSLGLEPVLAVSDEEELEIALEYVDPEIFLLTASGHDGEEQLESVLDLLPDVPAGKLAIAEIPVGAPEIVGALERAGVDGVIVAADHLPHLGGDEPPEV